MTRISVFVLILAGAVHLSATSIRITPLLEQVRRADIIVIVHVDRVSALGTDGQNVTDPTTQTGVLSSNQFRLQVSVKRDGLLKGRFTSNTTHFDVPEWNGWVRDLGSFKKSMVGTDAVLFLSQDLQPSIPAEFDHSISEVEKIIAVINAEKKQINQTVPTPEASPQI